MSKTLTQVLINALEALVGHLKDGSINCSDEQISSVLEELDQYNGNRNLSKDKACDYMGLSRSTFDLHVKNGLIPKGKKVRGFKELCWKQCDLDKSKEIID